DDGVDDLARPVGRGDGCLVASQIHADVEHALAHSRWRSPRAAHFFGHHGVRTRHTKPPPRMENGTRVAAALVSQETDRPGDPPGNRPGPFPPCAGPGSPRDSKR